ncbi:neogenin-like [Montipora capricornis]|uniref:neogenin-like n=1 Tax=Montipora capricornis TaxID=246305 RepID=UPI0035F1CFD1
MNPPRSGRYVGILTTRKQFLQLCEVEIFAKGNIAFRKPAFGPDTSPAENVVDGNLETRSLAALRWKIDLGRKVPVKEVYYYTDPHHPYLVVRVASSSRPTEVGQECRHRAPINILHYRGIGRFHFLCWPRVLGRYVILQNTRRHRFSLLEVEVYSAQRGCQIQPICWFINDGRSSDDLYSASSSRVGYGPEDCRGAWLPSTKINVSDFLQINLGYKFYICAIATQGKPTYDQWTTKYMIHSSLDNITWMTYKENGTEKVFQGNTGLNDTVKHNLEEVITASFLRFQPTDVFGQKTLRVELYGALKSPVPVKTPILVKVTAQSSTSVAAFWELPKWYTNHKDILSFKLLYRSLASDTKNVTTALTIEKNFSTVVTGLEKFTEYEFKVCAFSSVGCGPKSSPKIARTLEDVPSKAPSKFVVTANTSTSVTASWQLPPTGSRNGIIKGFKLLINRKGSDDKPNVQLVNASNAAVYTKTVTGLQESTEYELQVLAYTSPGDGPKSSAQFVTTKGSDLKNSGCKFNGIQTHDLCYAGAMVYQLSYEATQLGLAGQFVGIIRSHERI